MRFDRDAFFEILDTLTRNKARSFLTGFGIFWGLFMLLFMFGGGDGVKQMLYKNFAGFATNTSILVANRTTMPYKGMKEGRWWSLNYSDVDRLKAMVPELDVVTPVISVYSSVAEYGDLTSDCSVKGLNADYAEIENPKIKYGRYLNQVDIINRRKVCVIGKNVYEDLFEDGGDPCGSFIRIGPVYYQVVGVDFNTGNISINGSTENSVVIPLPMAQQLYNRGNRVDLICMTGKEGVTMSSIEGRVREILAREHRFDHDDKDAMTIINTEQLFQLVDNIFKGVNFLIWLIGLGTLFAGAIGVSNIMMVTVKERTTEIGIRRAIGATPNDILSQIMLESVLLTMVSGLLSIVFSVFVLRIAETIASASMDYPISFQISFWFAIGAAALLAVLGLAAGFAPAKRAMDIKPVDAMRDE